MINNCNARIWIMDEYDEYLFDPLDDYLEDAAPVASSGNSSPSKVDEHIAMNIEEQKQAEYVNAINQLNSRIENSFTARQYSKVFSLNA